MSDDKDDWDFDVSEEEIKKADKVSSKEPAKRKSSASLLRQQKFDSPTLDVRDSMPRKSRSNVEDYFEKEKDPLSEVPSLVDRATSVGIDLACAAILKIPAGMYADATFNAVYKFCNEQLGDTSFLEVPYIRSVMIYLNYFILLFIFFGLLGSIMRRTPGKFVAKIIVEDIDGGQAGFARSFFRETIGKALSLGSVIGFLLIFVTKEKRGLHDYLFKTIVRKI